MKMRLFLVTVLLVLGQKSFGSTSLSSALQSGSISITATGSGNSYYGKGLHLRVKNKTDHPLQLAIDPALIFQPADPSYQPLVLAGETIVNVISHGETGVDLQSFCGNINANAPGKDIVFTLQKQGDSKLIKLIRFINKNQCYNSSGQHAVWALTNDLGLSGIYDEEHPDLSNKLLALTIQLTGKPAPDYFKQYRLNTTANEPVLEMRTLKIYSVFKWRLTETRKLSMGIYNSRNELKQTVFDAKDFIKGDYKLTVQFEAKDVPRDTYFIRLKDDETLMKEQQIVVD